MGKFPSSLDNFKDPQFVIKVNKACRDREELEYELKRLKGLTDIVLDNHWPSLDRYGKGHYTDGTLSIIANVDIPPPPAPPPDRRIKNTLSYPEDDNGNMAVDLMRGVIALGMLICLFYVVRWALSV